MQQTHETTLILGGMGKTGRRIAQRLKTRGLPLRVASRSTTPHFDWDDPVSWAPVLAGAKALYIAYPPDLALPSAAPQIGELAQDAAALGVRKIVLLSGRGEPHVLPSERAVRESGAAYTILRSSWFAQNFSEGLLLGPLLEGELVFPAGNSAEPFIDLDDVADVAVEALTDPRHDNQIYELSGPRLLTFEQAVGAISAASGRDLRYRPISAEQYAKTLEAFMPAHEAAFLKDLFEFTLDGHNAYLSDGVQRVLGRAPRDFAEVARRAARAGAWHSGVGAISTGT
jgi:uncharacterized protein YbjT (DUF2867 family)